MTKTNRVLKQWGLPLLLLPLVAHAQTLTLFEPLDANNAPLGAAAQPGAANATLAGAGQPAFTLRSTSRVGDRYHVVLVNRDGTISQVAWQAGQSAAVPGHSGFAITQVAGRSVALTQPESCIAAPDKGVSCGADNQALLALATVAPVTVKSAAAQRPNQDPFASAGPNNGRRGNRDRGRVGPGGDQGNNGGQGNGPVVVNPFTGAAEPAPQLSAEEQAARADRQRVRTVQPRRIDDADIPPGTQRVRTPFGDTLVPAQ
jgi:hypothetical protein